MRQAPLRGALCTGFFKTPKRGKSRRTYVIRSLVSGLFFTVVDEVPTQAPDSVLISLSIASDSDLTANLSLALRAARVEAVWPSESAVRAVNGAEG